MSNDRTRASVLLIEDDQDIRELVTLSLTRQGYNVTSTTDGLAGLRSFYLHEPSLVIIDVGIPKMDGWEVCRHIRSVTNIPIIFLSAHGYTTDKARGLDLGADDYVTKPFSQSELVARVDQALRRSKWLTETEGSTY